MSSYTISFFNDTGDVEQKSVSASTEAEALAISGIPSSRVKTVKKSVSLISSRIPKIKPDDQIQILTELAGAIESGLTETQALISLLAVDPTKTVHLNAIETCDGLVESLQILSFDPMAVSAAKAGTKVGGLPEALLEASDVIKGQAEIAKAVIGPLVQGLLYIVIGLSALFFVVPFISVQVEGMVGSDMGIEPNALTFTLIYLGSFLRNFGFLFPIIIFLYAYFCFKNWDRYSGLPVLNRINDLFIYKRSIRLASLYKVLQKRGIVAEEIIKLSSHNASNYESNITKSMVCRLNEGESPLDVVSTKYWSPSLQIAFTNIDKGESNAIERSLSYCIQTMSGKRLNVAKKLTRICSLIGFTSMGVVMILMFGGFTYPLFGMMSSGIG